MLYYIYSKPKQKQKKGNEIMLKLEDIIVWRTLDGMITVTSCLESMKICEIVNHHVNWFNKDICSAEVLAWVENNR